ncbi:MAG: replicative DNA helicase [Candidatus Melainabacteria bacterium]|jgi:replicative DNA helicase|nr:replicative DNA helicase [Candidatus Melainabacteria bacterium]
MSTSFANKKNHNDLLPNSIEAEQAVLGAILVDGEALHKVVEHIDSANFFYKRAHQLIYEAFLRLNEKSENIDILTASQYLKDQNQIEEIGGRSYLSALTDHAPIAANAPHYAKIIKAKSLLRNMILAGNHIVELGHQSEEDLDTLVDKAEQLIFNLSQSKSKDQLIHIGDLVHKSWKILEEREANKNQLSGLDTGYHDFNTLTSGLQKSDLLILAARPAMGKCLAKDSEILLEDGSLASIEEIYKSQNAKLLTLDTNWNFKFTKPSDFIDDGIKPIFEVKTRSGRAIKTTLSHPYLTIEGWKKLAELQAGDKVAVPRIINVFGKERLRDCEAKLLGYLIGDGSLTKSSTSFTNTNPQIQEDFIQAVTDFDPGLKTKKSSNDTRADSFRVSKDHEFLVEQRTIFAQNFKQIANSKNISYKSIAQELEVSPSLVTLWHQGLIAPDQDCFTKLCNLLDSSETELAPKGLNSISKNQKSSLNLWLEEMGLQGKNSHTKEIPQVVFKLNKAQIALLLNRLFATDGWASQLSSGQSQLGYASVSDRLIKQVQHLLLRFGILSSVRHKTVKYKDGRRSSWQLNITDQNSIKTFISEIGIFAKEEAIAKVRKSILSKKAHSNKDLVPVEIWKSIERAKGTESWSSLAKRSGFQSTSNIHAHKRALSRNRLAAMAAALGNQELKDVASSDVYWDQIVSIEHLGSEQVYDLTIAETHNFVANDICVHNTSLALNIAENVAINTKKPVALFSLEMSKEQLVQRLLCSRAEVDSSRVRSGQLHADDWARLGTAMSELGEAPLYLDDSGGVSVMELRGKCRRLQAMTNGELGLVVIDYLQLLEGRSNDSRINQISEISRGLKMMARELNVPVMALSQLSRAVESRQDKRPMLSDLRDSGSIEQDADIVVFIYRDDYYNPESEKAGIADVIIAKHRSGPVGVVELLFQSNITKFKNPAPGYQG